MSTFIKRTSSHRAARIKLAVVAALALPAFLASCADSPTTPLASVSREITSGAVPGGQRALFFLTRPLDRRTFSGTFDGTLTPQVLVCSEPRCITPVLGPIGLGSTGPATLTLDAARQSYVFRWQTRRGPLAPNAVYRLVVRVGDYQLGWVDLATGTKQRDLRNVNRREFVPLQLGSTLALPFRIEQGAPFPPDLPGRYESMPDACPPLGCALHSVPDFDYLGVWAAVQITQTGTAATGMLWYASDRIHPPVVPPIPAPGTGPLNGSPDGSDFSMVSWRHDESDPCLELWDEGLLWGHWCGSFGGPASVTPAYLPFDAFGTLYRLPNYLPPLQ
jgi:hypothetical protein